MKRIDNYDTMTNLPIYTHYCLGCGTRHRQMGSPPILKCDSCGMSVQTSDYLSAGTSDLVSAVDYSHRAGYITSADPFRNTGTSYNTDGSVFRSVMVEKKRSKLLNLIK